MYIKIRKLRAFKIWKNIYFVIKTVGFVSAFLANLYITGFIIKSLWVLWVFFLPTTGFYFGVKGYI